MIYFAYSSNLDQEQMRVRSRRARATGPARLDGYRLCFPRRSFVRQSALASIEPANGSTVWGGLYEIADSDVGGLDGREGYHPRNPFNGNVSNRVQVTVVVPDDSRDIIAMTYVLVPQPNPGLPTSDYMTMLINGAVGFRAPDEYVALLLAVPTIAIADVAA